MRSARLRLIGVCCAVLLLTVARTARPAEDATVRVSPRYVPGDRYSVNIGLNVTERNKGKPDVQKTVEVRFELVAGPAADSEKGADSPKPGANDVRLMTENVRISLTLNGTEVSGGEAAGLKDYFEKMGIVLAVGKDGFATEARPAKGRRASEYEQALISCLVTPSPGETMVAGRLTTMPVRAESSSRVVEQSTGVQLAWGFYEKNVRVSHILPSAEAEAAEGQAAKLLFIGANPIDLVLQECYYLPDRQKVILAFLHRRTVMRIDDDTSIEAVKTYSLTALPAAALAPSSPKPGT